MLAETVQWNQERAIAEGGEAFNTHVDAGSLATVGNRLFNLASRLDTGVPPPGA